jgi:hypothetical protein
MSEWAIGNRSGDSETETDLVELFLVANEKLDEITLEIDEKAQLLLCCIWWLP